MWDNPFLRRGVKFDIYLRPEAYGDFLGISKDSFYSALGGSNAGSGVGPEGSFVIIELTNDRTQPLKRGLDRYKRYISRIERRPATTF